MPDIFLSYAREDEARVAGLVAALERQGWNVFWDRHLAAGSAWRSEIAEALHAARAVIVAWSARSVHSQWVIEEAEAGRQAGRLIPVLIDPVEPPLGFRGIQSANLAGSGGDFTQPELVRLIADVRALLETRQDSLDGVPSHARATEPPTGRAAAAPRASRPAIAAVAVVLLAGVLIVAFWVWAPSPGRGQNAATPPLASQPAASGEAPAPSVNRTSDARRAAPAGSAVIGRVETRDGVFEFHSIGGMAMGNGALALNRFGTRVDVPLKDLAKVGFSGDERAELLYRDGRRETARLDCYWNAPVTFRTGSGDIYYGDCTALAAVTSIELFR